MGKKILTYPTFYEAGEAAVRAIQSRVVDLGVRHILIVPDKYTLYYEKRLFAGGGAFDVEVLTLNRLFQRAVTDESAYLSRQGAIMLLRGLVAENADKLCCFRRSAQFKGFAEKLYNVFTQLLSSGVDVDGLTADGALGMKLDDIRLLYRLYRQKTAGRYTDAAGRLELLRLNSDCAYVRGAVLYVAGHYGVTRQTRAVWDALAAHARELTVFECEPDAGRLDDATVYAAPDDVTAVKAAARRINNLVYGGARYGEFGVVTAGSTAEIKRIFTEHGIPFFADSSVKLITHPLARYVLTALDCVGRGYRRRDMIKLVKNPCAGIDRRDADAFENRCNEYLVDYLGFFRPFDDEAAERARAAAAGSLEPFYRAVRAANSPALFARAVSDFLAGAVCDDRQARDKIDGLLDQLSSLLPERCPVSLIADCFTEGLNAAVLGTLPNHSDTVTVGAPEVFRGQRFAHMIILGFNDGVLPAYVADGGLLSDTECETLGGIEPTTAQINIRAAEEIRQVARSSPDVFITYTDGGGARPSGVLTAMLGRNCRFLSAADEADALRYETGDALSAAVIDMCADRASALELMITGARGGQLAAATLAAAIDGSERYLNPPVSDSDTVDARGLYFAGGKVGVTELSCYFDCPRMHFYRYGLKLHKRETGEMSGLDVGNFLHAVAERFAGLDGKDQTEQAVRSIVRDVAGSQKKYRLEQNAALQKRLEEEAVRLCSVIRRQLDAGTYVSYAREAEFGPGKAFPAVPLSTPYGDILLSGKIDRVDVSGDFIRVIDYKTGGTGFSYASIYYGKQLQLPIYMRAVQGERRPGGMFYFPFKTRWSDDDSGCRLDGLFDCSPQSLLAHDRGYENPRHEGTVVRCTAVVKDGVIKPDRPPKTAVTGEYIGQVCDYAVAAAQTAVCEMAEGYAAPAPLSVRRQLPCRYCDYAPICSAVAPRFAGTPGPESLLFLKEK